MSRFNRRTVQLILALYLCLGGALRSAAVAAPAEPPRHRIPVILDTDIGDDIDDTWALVMLLRTPQLDLRLVSTTDGQADYRARLVAKLLTIAGRSDVPIALGDQGIVAPPGANGSPTTAPQEREKRWLGDYRLSDYRGKVHRDGVRALIDAVHHSPEPVTIIAIGPLQTLAAALEKDPSIARNANLVGMQGSVFKGYNGSPTPSPEFNVKMDVPAARKVLSAPWRSIAITPLDTCGLPGVSLTGEQYQSVQHSIDPLVRAILDSYAAWSRKDAGQLRASTVLFDTVAIYLADPEHRPLLKLRELKIAVRDDGITAVSETGKEMSVATEWTDLPRYREQLVETLLGAD